MARPRIRWTRPLRDGAAPPGAPKTAAPVPADDAGEVDLPHASPGVRTALKARGTPFVEGVSPKEEAITLLQLAAEVEHALLVQYLYAGLSLSHTAGGAESPFTTLQTVATQEMGHLISVQNLLLSIGGTAAVHFSRDTLRTAEEEGRLIPFVLEPVTRESLAKYVTTEMPAQIADEELRKAVEPLVAIARNAGVVPHGVGALYAKIFWLFQPTDDPTPPLNLSPAPAAGLMPGRHLSEGDFVGAQARDPFMALRPEWIQGSVTDFKLEPVTDRTSALQLIAEVSKQGEGLEDALDSHFLEFVALSRSLEAGAFTPSLLPRTPFAAVPPPSDATGTTPIQHPYARVWAELFDVRYNLLVHDLWHAMVTDRSSAARAGLIRLAYANMVVFLRELCAQMARLRGEPVHAADAGPPFGSLEAEFPADEIGRWERHVALLQRQAEITQRLEERPEFRDADGNPVDLDGFFLVQNIAQDDQERQALIDAGIAG